MKMGDSEYIANLQSSFSSVRPRVSVDLLLSRGEGRCNNTTKGGNTFLGKDVADHCRGDYLQKSQHFVNWLKEIVQPCFLRSVDCLKCSGVIFRGHGKR